MGEMWEGEGEEARPLAGDREEAASTGRVLT